MPDRMEINLTGTTFTDEIHQNLGASAFKLSDFNGYPDDIDDRGHDLFIQQDLVIRDAAAGGGNLLVEGTDYDLSNEDTDLSARVTAAVGSDRNVYSTITITNAAYQAVTLYFSGKYVADANSAEDYNYHKNRPQECNSFDNPKMEVAQRGTSFAAASDGDYTLDRYYYVKKTTGAVHTITQDSDTPSDDFNYSLKVDCTTADAAVAARNEHGCAAAAGALPQLLSLLVFLKRQQRQRQRWQ